MSTVTYNAAEDTRGDHIGWAMYQLKKGKKVRRRSWFLAQHIKLVRTLHGEAIYFGWNDCYTIYACSQSDLLATDWEFTVEGK